MQIQDFVGSYTVHEGSTQRGAGGGITVDQGDRIYIGTGTHNDPPPDGDRVGMALISAQGLAKLPVSGAPPAWFSFENGSLAYQGETEGGLRIPFTIQFSLYSDAVNAYKALYGVTTAGDPDQVAVWGADDNDP